MVKQTDAEGHVNEVSVSTEGFEFPVYTQGLPYAIIFETFEEYINYDGGEGNEFVDQVPITDGEFNITNNLALPNLKRSLDEENANISKYVFRAGFPAISPPFTRRHKY